VGENYQTEQGQLDDSPESKGERDHQGQVTDDTYVDVCMQMPAYSAMCKHGYSYIHTRTYTCMMHTHRCSHIQPFKKYYHCWHGTVLVTDLYEQIIRKLMKQGRTRTGQD